MADSATYSHMYNISEFSAKKSLFLVILSGSGSRAWVPFVSIT